MNYNNEMMNSINDTTAEFHGKRWIGPFSALGPTGRQFSPRIQAIDFSVDSKMN